MTDETNAQTQPPAKKVAEPETVTVVLVGPSHGAPAGTRRSVTRDRAESLVARGLARYATPQQG